jgi:predicted Fe-S protein YdhL (DUF1289 family)
MNMPAGGAPPLSPCVKVCAMDAARGYCLGCTRTLSEIARWWSMRDDEKRAVLAALPLRARSEGCAPFDRRERRGD